MAIVFRKDQKEIMKYKSGTMGIQAVPGAGKTFIITNLVAKLLVNMDEDGQEGKILVLTYMNSAANNFKSRIRSILEEKGIDRCNFEVMTIHSLAMKIIRENTDIAMVSEESQVIDDYKKNLLIQMAIDEDIKTKIKYFLKKEMRANQDQIDKWYKEFVNIALNTIKLLKYADISVDRAEYFVKEQEATIMKIIVPIYKNYQTMLNNEGYFDYDDILIKAYRILIENNLVAEKYQNKYTYVFEDECQDSNQIQGKIIEIISHKGDSRKKSKKNLVRVGDINQSITGSFTGSDPKYFKDFCIGADYSYEMDMAARSSQDIIDVANLLVDKSSGQLENIYIKPVDKGKSYKENPSMDKYMVNARSLKKQEEERDLIAKTIHYYQKYFPSYNIGILSFSNYETDELGKYLDSKSIKYDKLGGDSKERKKIIGDIKLFIDFILEPSKNKFLELLLEAFVVRYKLEIGEEDISIITRQIDDSDYEALIYDRTYRQDWLNKLKVRLDDRIRLEVYKNMQNSLESIREICESNKSDKKHLIVSMISKLNLTSKEILLSKYVLFYIGNLITYEDADLFRISTSLDNKYSRVFDGAIESIYDMGDNKVLESSVTLSTIHKSKGMEWDAVIISGINKSDFPSSINDYFRIDRKYLREDFKYPEAFVNMDIDRILGENIGRDRVLYEVNLKKNLIAERIRLLYVAITRAKSSLLLLNSKNKFIEATNKTIYRKDSAYLDILIDYISKRKGRQDKRD